MTKREIVKLSKEENIFHVAKSDRGTTIASVVYERINSIPEELHQLMDTGDLEIQRLIVLISIMKTERLFFEFMYEVFRDKIIVGDVILRDSDFRTFFHEKQMSNDTVAKWSEASLKNLRKTYKSYLADAGLIDRLLGDRNITKPYLSPEHEDTLIRLGMEPFLKALGRICP